MFEYRIEVKPWMLKESSEDFDFMRRFNQNKPMPLLVMYTGGKVEESAKMVKLNLHGDIKQRVTTTCMACGRPITNKISQYFGIGPKCGGHNYVNPFSTEDELNDAVRKYREKLVNTTWCGWIPLSAIKSIDEVSGLDNIKRIVADMPVEIMDAPVVTEIQEPQAYTCKVTVYIRKPERGTDDFSAFLHSSYNKELVDSIKAIRSSARKFNPEDKSWEIDYKEFEILKEKLSQSTKTNFEFTIYGEELLPKKINAAAAYSFKTQPMQHQLEGIQYGLDHSRYLLGDEMGCGKTKQVIDLACIRKHTFGFRHCLIICGVNSLKWNWLEEIEKHSDEKGYILGQYIMPRRKKLAVKGNPAKLADLEKLADPKADYPYFIITNIESIRNVDIADKIKELCDAKIFDMVAIDEAHRIRNLNTKTGESILKIQPYYRIAMTGTPLINTPLDLYALLKWLGYQPYSYLSFRDHFCERDEWGSVIGYKNLDQLREQLSAIMLRRTKAEVLDLPDKVYINEYVELTSEQKNLYNQIIDKAIEDAELSSKLDLDCVLAVYSRLRQVSGGIGPFGFIKQKPKLDRLEQLVEEAVYSGTKVIVYSNWVEGITPAVERLKGYNPVVITGETNDSDRQALVSKFQNDDSVKVICGTIGALGTGLTLTAATVVVFLDEPWTNAIKEQAIDRAHRIGTTTTITVYTLMSYGTYDEEVHDIVLGKRELSDRIVDKKDLLRLKVA